MSTMAMPQPTASEAAVRYLITNYSPKGNKVGWLMMASILVEAWDLYSIAFVLIFIKEQYNPDPLMLGLAAAGTQGGALIGALLGGWLSDKIGRRVMFLVTMVLFIVLALAQAFVPTVGWLVVIRFLLGIPLGSDISTGYTYIMESMAKGEREVMGNRWQFMFAVGEVLTIGVIVIFLLIDMQHEMLWRVTLGLGAVPALIILIMRHDVPETAVWLVQKGRYREAKQSRARCSTTISTCCRTRMWWFRRPARVRSSPTSRRIRSAGAPRSTAGSLVSPRRASSRPLRSTCPCCS
ncbi:hypothetical protein BRDID11004_30910 [Bradyrhizobium diazoefficiens]